MSAGAWYGIPNLLLCGEKVLMESVKTSLQRAGQPVKDVFGRTQGWRLGIRVRSLVVMSTDWLRVERGGSPYGACRDRSARSFHGRTGWVSLGEELDGGLRGL